jgi:8-oxo-dGTP diphosphatase
VGIKGVPDEHSVRAACAAVLSQADSLKLTSIAIPALGCAVNGLSPVASGKIMIQEVMRLARGGKTGLKTIWLCCADKKAFPAFKKAVTGYLKHFLEVLQWGPFVTVDAIIETPDGIVLVERSNPPFGYALPGGFVDYGESLQDAVRREAREETGLELEGLFQFHTYSDPGRDPRFHTVTTVFGAKSNGRPRAGDDAAAIKVARPQDIEGLPMAFDHGQVLKEYLARKRE